MWGDLAGWLAHSIRFLSGSVSKSKHIDICVLWEICSFCRRSHADFWRFGDRCSKASPTCLLAAWHVCGKPACLEPAMARFADMFAMSTGSLKRDWRELTARVQN